MIRSLIRTESSAITAKPSWHICRLAVRRSHWIFLPDLCRTGPRCRAANSATAACGGLTFPAHRVRGMCDTRLTLSGEVRQSALFEEVLDPQSGGASHWQFVELRRRDKADLARLQVGDSKLAAHNPCLEAD